MIKSLGSFVKRKVADLSSMPPPHPPPRPPPPRPPPPKDELIEGMEFDNESEFTDVMNITQELEALEEKDLDEVLNFADDDVFEDADDFVRVPSADSVKKSSATDQVGQKEPKNATGKPSQSLTSGSAQEESKDSKGPEETVFEPTVVGSQPSVTSNLSSEIFRALDASGLRGSSEHAKAITPSDSKADTVSIRSLEFVEKPKTPIMKELDDEWIAVETSISKDLQLSDTKRTDISVTSQKVNLSKDAKFFEEMEASKSMADVVQTVYVAEVSQVSKVYVMDTDTGAVAQKAEITQSVSQAAYDTEASEDPDYAENTDVAEELDYTEDETDDELFKRESDFWEIDFDKYMDALLADLQNTITPGGTTPGTPHPAHNGTATPSPGPSPNSTLNHHHFHNGHDQMYHQERVEEVRTEQRSSGGTKMASLNNNLSELDTLLQDLNNARYTGVFKEPTATTNGTVNDSRPSVDSLLDELNSVDTSREIIEQRTVTHEVRTTKSPLPVVSSPLALQQISSPHASASTATKELDDLMASLSDFKKGDLNDLESQIIQERLVSERTSVNPAAEKRPPSVEEKKESTKRVTNFKKKSTVVTDVESSTLSRAAPPRPPPPDDSDVLAVPPPRPPVPRTYSSSPLPPEAYIFGSPVLIPVPTGVGRGHYIPHQQLVDNPLEDPFHRPPSGGPVRRNDAEYRWVTDSSKYEVREIDFPCVSEKKQENLRSPALVRKLINASSLQTQVDSAYAKPQKPKSPSPPTPPTPTPTPPKEPTPPPVNQLDCMLGSLATHMTEQGITTTQKGCCCACDKPIVGQVITALGKTWHPEHFTCSHCNQELGTRNFFERDGKPYCEVDYHNLFSPRCAYCNGPILDKCVTALDKTWHPDHFFCAQCGNTFGEDGFHEKDGKPYCREDYFNMFAPKCGGCNAPIMDNYISALNAQWHPECFVCRDCRQPFNGGSFFDHEGLPYCETHYHAKRGSLCAGCHKPITGRCITAMFRKFHPEHFVCSFCLKQLNKGTFKEQNDKPYCHGCFDKLFG